MRSELKYGLLAGLSAVTIIMLCEIGGFNQLSNFKIGNICRMLIPLLLIPFVFVAISKKKYTENNGSLTFFEGLMTGQVVAIIFSIIFSLTFWIFLKYINPIFKEIALQYENSVMIKSGVDAATIKTQLQAIGNIYSGTFQNHFMIVFTYTVFGTLVALVISLFMKSRAKN
nr:DUF4199 domain-containing protein [Bacteroidota bacterium]